VELRRYQYLIFLSRNWNMRVIVPNWKSTAIFVTVDEGGGYEDSGFIQPVDFFGTGRAFR
jgi:hypothetical protein